MSCVRAWHTIKQQALTGPRFPHHLTDGPRPTGPTQDMTAADLDAAAAYVADHLAGSYVATFVQHGSGVRAVMLTEASQATYRQRYVFTRNANGVLLMGTALSTRTGHEAFAALDGALTAVKADIDRPRFTCSPAAGQHQPKP